MTMRLQFVPVSGSNCSVIVVAERSADDSLAAVSVKIFPVHEGIVQVVVPLTSERSVAAILAPSRAAF